MRSSDWSSDVCSSDLAVEFAAVQPDAAALRAVVDLDALAVGHGQVHVVTGGAQHSVLRWGGRRAVASPCHSTSARGAAVLDKWVRGKRPARRHGRIASERSEEHTSELQSLMRISYAVFCLQNTNKLMTDNIGSNMRTANT